MPHIDERKTMKTLSTLLSFALIAAGFVGCNPGPKSSKGFSLPDGNALRGEEAFVNLKCHACHTVTGVQLPAENKELSIPLGGEVTRIKTYGELVTSIINPSHKLAKSYSPVAVEADGKSKMKNYNEVMSVGQLIDLVAFLQSRYKLREYETTDYPVYP